MKTNFAGTSEGTKGASASACKTNGNKSSHEISVSSGFLNVSLLLNIVDSVAVN